MDITQIIISYPKPAIIILSLIVTIFITIVSYYLTDRELLKRIKEKQKRLREEMKQHKENPQKMMEINKQMMEDFPTQMKQSFKTSLVTLVPLLLLFNWLRVVYEQTTLTGWIWWYIGSSLAFSIILRKVFKLD
jgi:uncharacterized membrane protein (DUF106 family)